MIFIDDDGVMRIPRDVTHIYLIKRYSSSDEILLKEIYENPKSESKSYIDFSKHKEAKVLIIPKTLVYLDPGIDFGSNGIEEER